MFIVTVKLPRNPAHDPRNKVTGPCPLDPSVQCTDVTGEHHSVVSNYDTVEQVRLWYAAFHITRIEEVELP